MKRGREDVDGLDGAKRGHRLRHVFKALCTENLTGHLLGFKGTLKEEIQRETGVALKFSSKSDYYPNTQYRVLGMYSDDGGSILRALEAVVLRIAELAEEERVRPPQPGNELVGKDAGEYIFRFCLTVKMARLLIGNKGATIQKLRKDTNAKVFVENETWNEHRYCRVIGTTDSLMLCLEEVNNLVQAEPWGDDYECYHSLVSFSEAPVERVDRGHQSWEGGDDTQSRFSALSEAVRSLPEGTEALPYAISFHLQPMWAQQLEASDCVREIEELSGTTVEVAQGTDDDTSALRSLSVVGPLLHCYYAHALVLRAVLKMEAEEQEEARRLEEAAEAQREAEEAAAAAAADAADEAEAEVEAQETRSSLEGDIHAKMLELQKQLNELRDRVK